MHASVFPREFPPEEISLLQVTLRCTRLARPRKRRGGPITCTTGAIADHTSPGSAAWRVRPRSRLPLHLPAETHLGAELGPNSAGANCGGTRISPNFCFGVIDEKIDYIKLDKILNEVELNEVIKNLDKGISTIVGDQGLTLSGGQRQKIALARTLYLDPKIIIFDESTNSLDKKTEKQFFKNIISLKKNKIIICITHDLGLSEYFDQIYDLSQLNENK